MPRVTCPAASGSAAPACRFLRSTALRVRSPLAQSANVEVIDPDGHRPLSLSEARTAQTFRLARAGFYQIRFANGRDAVIGVNPDRRESDLEPISPDVLKLWSGSARNNPRNKQPLVRYRSKRSHRKSLVVALCCLHW